MAFYDTMASIFGRRKKPEKPTRYRSQERGAGFRGVARGDRPVNEEGQPTYTAEEITRWSSLTGDEVERFLYDKMVLQVNSTNVDKAQYDRDERKLLVKYLDSNTVHGYGDVSEGEAESFLKTGSKGTWIWDNIKIRGTVKGHKKPWNPHDHFRPEVKG